MRILMLALLAAGDSDDYAVPMRKVAARFTGREGVVLHLGDSITYANPYSAWARYGKGVHPGFLWVQERKAGKTGSEGGTEPWKTRNSTGICSG